ncbi:hypothetical protein BWD14_19625, partial [Leptospira santarosai]
MERLNSLRSPINPLKAPKNLLKSENIHQFGVVAKILKKVHLPDDAVNILINTIRRFKIDSYTSK